MDGFELIKRIREHAKWNQVPIIMLTSKSQEQHIVRALGSLWRRKIFQGVPRSDTLYVAHLNGKGTALSHAFQGKLLLRERNSVGAGFEDFRVLEEAAHGLKSGAANIGAREMSRLCAQLETQGELGHIGNASEVMEKLVASWTSVRDLITRYH